MNIHKFYLRDIVQFDGIRINFLNKMFLRVRHENLHAFSCVCASFFVYPTRKCQKMKNGKTRKIKAQKNFTD